MLIKFRAYISRSMKLTDMLTSKFRGYGKIANKHRIRISAGGGTLFGYAYF